MLQGVIITNNPSFESNMPHTSYCISFYFPLCRSRVRIINDLHLDGDANIIYIYGDDMAALETLIQNVGLCVPRSAICCRSGQVTYLLSRQWSVSTDDVIHVLNQRNAIMSCGMQCDVMSADKKCEVIRSSDKQAHIIVSGEQ